SVTAAHVATAHANSRLRAFFGGSSPIIDFLEELKVLTDLGIAGVYFASFFVGLPCLVELSFVLVANRQIVVGGRVGRVDLGSFFPSVDRLAPQALLRDIDTKGDLSFGIAAGVRIERRR